MNYRSDGFFMMQIQEQTSLSLLPSVASNCYGTKEMLNLGAFGKKDDEIYIIGFQYISNPSTIKWVNHISVKGCMVESCGEEGQFWNEVSGAADFNSFQALPLDAAFFLGEMCTNQFK